MSKSRSLEIKAQTAQVLDQTVREQGYRVLKRLIDLTGSLLLLLLAAPVMALISLLIRLSSPGAILYRQERLTQNGKVFTIYKFRTMTDNAEEASGAVWADHKDPRITTIGRLLRRTRLDELPQLFNVLSGDMSLVGPRPERPELARELLKELPDFNNRLSVKAGLTGLAQVGAGYAACLDSCRDKLNCDLYYIQNRSTLLDIKILLRTILVVLSGRGSR